MRADEFFEIDDPFGLDGGGRRRLDLARLRAIRAGPDSEHSDIEVAVPLARLVHEEFITCGTSGDNELGLEEIREALLALKAVVARLGIENFDVPFRDFTSFRSYWSREGATGSWEARRQLLAGIFDPLHDQLAELETRSLSSTLADPITSHERTGWFRVDEEIGELRRHFEAARTAQDYRNVGNDCVTVLEALSEVAFDPELHLAQGEEAPPVAKTKERVGKVIATGAPGPQREALRRLARGTIEVAQGVKHRPTSTRTDAGVAADAVILLTNIVRRLVGE